jgi:DNA-directed RNA polymerase subunit RPC12/RpoP
MNKITCPYCGAEYLPQELYIPSDFLPKYDDLVRDDSGKIVAAYNMPMNLHEEYECVCCGHRFQIDADVKFTVSKIEEHDFKFNYESNLYDNYRLELKEND